MKEKVEFFMNFLTCVLSIEKKKKNTQVTQDLFNPNYIHTMAVICIICLHTTLQNI